MAATTKEILLVEQDQIQRRRIKKKRPTADGTALALAIQRNFGFPTDELPEPTDTAK